MRFEEYQILQLVDQLSPQERKDMRDRGQQALNVPVDLSAETLSSMRMEHLIPLRDMIRGYILTKRYVPDIKGAYEAMKSTKLPNRIGFGRMEEED
ncbi:hypothetical protein FHS18_002327 [Paenibacillus phyllosphaerae]|uniref:Uncharacterized protein n=1 Tax=Paenibacillus phyllosphaerae TaxID=274593 RepID=A0A7W5FMG8_9BACL|nr:hypothetical protein [Paenibacillus phyllosphaerae]MBB3110260.1 hypothetical protein [Paenibacillus phyllosphaerae]